MKKNLRVIGIIICLLAFGLPGFSQQKLILLNGKILEVKDVRRENYKIFYKTEKRPDKEKSMSEFRVFSIENMGIEQLVYVEDTLFEDEFSVAEMRMYVKGQQDARAHYHPTLLSIGAFAVGVGAAPLAFYGMAVPPIYTQIAGAISPNMEKQKGANKDLLSSEAYVEGYKKRARDMKIQRTLLYGYTGFIAGFTGLVLISAD